MRPSRVVLNGFLLLCLAGAVATAVLVGWPDGWKLGCLLAIAAVLAGVVYEKRRSIEARLAPARCPWTQPTDEPYRAVKRFAHQLLASPSLEAARPNATGLRLGRDLAGLLRRKPRTAVNGWENGSLALGFVTCLQSGGDADLPGLERYVDRVIDSAGAFRRKITEIDGCMIGYTLLELFERTGQSRYRAAADHLVHYICHQHPRTATGAMPFGATNHVLVDVLAMACPFLTRYGLMFDAPDAVELAVHQCEDYLQHGIDPQTHLPHHGYHVERLDGLGTLGWTRGAGWFAIGMSDTLAHLPADHPKYAELAGGFRSVAEALRDRQLDTGGWAWAAPLTFTAMESSGTATVAYGLARAIEIGVLDDDFSPVTDAALTALVRATDSDGAVTRGHTVCEGLGRCPQRVRFSRWTQGCTLGLFEMVRRRNGGSQ